MQVYTIEIIQTLTGYVEIEAESPEAAKKAAHKRFEENGEQLPEMECVDGLQFLISEAVCEFCLKDFNPAVLDQKACSDCKD